MPDVVDILMPLELEGTTATVRSWLKQVGDDVRQDEPLLELETDKVTTEVPAPADGMLAEIILDTESPAEAGALLGRIHLNNSAPASSETGQTPTSFVTHPPAPASASPTRVRLSPAVRRAVAQHDVDPSQVPATGRNGRLTRADVERYVAQRDESTVQNVPDRPAGAAPERFPEAAATSLLKGRTLPVDRMRLAIAENMSASLSTAPHVTAVFEADFSAISAHRAKHKAEFQAQGVGLTYTAYLVAASVVAMKTSPLINSRWHGHSIELFDNVNIGIGTALGDKGLVVPVVHDAQSLSLFGIASRLQDITSRARNNALKPSDMSGGTFTISNHGVSGSLLAAPIIIVQRQSAILGVGKLEKRVVVREIDGIETLQIRPIAYVSLTIDHRVVDGHQTNAWLSAFVSVLECWPSD